MADNYPEIILEPSERQLWYARKLWTEAETQGLLTEELRDKHQDSVSLPEVSTLINDLKELMEKCK